MHHSLSLLGTGWAIQPNPGWAIQPMWAPGWAIQPSLSRMGAEWAIQPNLSICGRAIQPDPVVLCLYVVWSVVMCCVLGRSVLRLEGRDSGIECVDAESVCEALEPCWLLLGRCEARLFASV